MTEGNTEYAISAYSLKKVYRNSSRIAVDSVSFNIPHGELVSVIGENGAGKSTLLEMIACIQKITAGQLIILGKDAEKEPATIRRMAAFLPQKASLFPSLTVKENLRYFESLHTKHLDINEVIEKMKLSDIIDQKIKNLSGGQRQRAYLSCIMIGNPELVLLDEPSTGLDAQTRKDTWRAFADLRDNGKTVIISTHDIIEARQYSDRLIWMIGGHIKFNGPPSGLCTNIEIRITDKDRRFDSLFNDTERHGDILYIIAKDPVELSESIKKLTDAGIGTNEMTVMGGYEIHDPDGADI